MQNAGGKMYFDFQINPSDLRARRSVSLERQPLEQGQVRFRVDSFAFTANNITYAKAGTALGYLDFFPARLDGPWRRIPVMGHGKITESAHPDIQAGGRYFGFFPMSGEHVIAAEPRGVGLWDAGSHRARHAATYRQFTDVRRDPQYDPTREDLVALLRGLFITAYLVEDYLFDHEMFGAQSVVVTSASSKTSIALGHCLRQRGTRSIGLTSARHLDAVSKLDCYGSVLTYEDVGALDPGLPTVLVDMAGDGQVLAAIHGHFGDALRYSSAVGMTHHASPPRPVRLPGPAPQFFFAPSQIEKRSKEWGAAELMGRMGGAFVGFAAFADSWLNIVRGAGQDAVDRAYLEVLDGGSSPTSGHILSLPG